MRLETTTTTTIVAVGDMAVVSCYGRRRSAHLVVGEMVAHLAVFVLVIIVGVGVVVVNMLLALCVVVVVVVVVVVQELAVLSVIGRDVAAPALRRHGCDRRGTARGRVRAAATAGAAAATHCRRLAIVAYHQSRAVFYKPHTTKRKACGKKLEKLEKVDQPDGSSKEAIVDISSMIFYSAI